MVGDLLNSQPFCRSAPIKLIKQLITELLVRFDDIYTHPKGIDSYMTTNITSANDVTDSLNLVYSVDICSKSVK